MLCTGSHLCYTQILKIRVIWAQLFTENGGEQKQDRKRAEENQPQFERVALHLLDAYSGFFIQSCTTPNLIRGSIA